MTHGIYWILSSTLQAKCSLSQHIFEGLFDRSNRRLTHGLTHSADKATNHFSGTNAAPKISFLQFFPQPSLAQTKYTMFLISDIVPMQLDTICRKTAALFVAHFPTVWFV